jgi:hypothetical protein
MHQLFGSAVFYKTKELPTRHCYSSMSLGGAWANEDGMSDANESKATLTMGQRESTDHRSGLHST